MHKSASAVNFALHVKKCSFRCYIPPIESIIRFRKMSSSSRERNPNRLVNERSPYLLQHAYNPVEWYPWGEEAFDKARNESKLIFLSIGYSTCHWCHVMEKESFENERIAEILNRDFVPIKVDKEERPDVDRVYMTFVQATSGHGGWPLNVWLTPTLKPYIGGTYFPPNDSYNRRGFKSILKVIHEKWNENKDSCNASADKIMSSIQKAVEVQADATSEVPQLQSTDKCAEQMLQRFDEDLGGFSGAPKFPQPVIFNFLLKYYACFPNTEMGRKALQMVTKTLTAMANGGIHDHIGYGFHRYSTDQYWHVPHFEKMLYDQGQLAVAYADCYAVTNDETYKNTLEKLLTYIERDLRHPSGGFYSAEDADSLPSLDDLHKTEGAFYVWTHDEIRDILGNDVLGNVTLADIVEFYYGIKTSGNVSFDQDPQGELRGKNVLIVRSTVDDVAEKMDLSASQVTTALEKARDKLMQEREKRPRPHLDNKMITAWNALMISGFCRAASVTGKDNYRKTAVQAALFIKEHLYVPETNMLLRSCYNGESGEVEQIDTPIEGFDADYAYTVKALIDLYEITHDDHWIELAANLQEKQTELFWDPENGGFYSVTQADTSILLRMKEDQDGAEPSANSISASNLLRLSAYLGKPELQAQCEKIFKAFSNRLATSPFALPEMASALLWLLKGHKQIVVRGEPKNETTQEFMKYLNSKFLPFKILIPPEISSSNGFLYNHLKDNLSGLMQSQDGDAEPKVFVCENFSCQLPVANLSDLKNLL